MEAPTLAEGHSMGGARGVTLGLGSHAISGVGTELGSSEWLTSS